MNVLKVNDNGIKEIEINTITDTKLQFNDLVIQYLEESNIISISYDTTPTTILYIYSVIKRGQPVRFKCYHSDIRLEICEPENMEIEQC